MDKVKMNLAVAMLADALGLDPDCATVMGRKNETGGMDLFICIDKDTPDIPDVPADAGERLADEASRYLSNPNGYL